MFLKQQNKMHNDYNVKKDTTTKKVRRGQTFS